MCLHRDFPCQLKFVSVSRKVFPMVRTVKLLLVVVVGVVKCTMTVDSSDDDVVVVVVVENAGTDTVEKMK